MARPDTPIAVAHDQDAPEPERRQALTELQKANIPKGVGDLLPRENTMRVINMMREQMEDLEMQKAQGGGRVIPFPGALDNRFGERGGPGGMKSVYLDSLQINAMGDYFEKPSGLSFDAQRQMVEQTPILGALIMTKIMAVKRFCQPQENDDGPGFAIRLADNSAKPSKDDTQQMKLLTKFFLNCGWEFNPRKRRAMHRDNLAGFMAKIVRDSLTMDSMPIETEYKRDKSRGMDGFYAVDGSTIRLCTERGYEGDDRIFALQVVQGRICTAYSYDDLIYEVRNPRADVRLAGYGLGECELLVRVVTGLLNAMTLNIRGFSDNAIPMGFLTLIGDYAEEDLNMFKRYWQSMVRGVNNRWNLPVLAASNPESAAKFEKIDTGFDEMYFSKWMTFLTSIICALYGTSPKEINFDTFTDSKSSLSGDDTEEKLANSTDKGFRPLMAYLESVLSDFICADFSDKFCLRWMGLEEEDYEKRHEMRKLLLSVDEARAEENYKPHPDPDIGGAPLNPALMPIYQQNLQQQQQDARNIQGDAEQGQGALDFGDGGDDAEGGPGDPAGAPEGDSPPPAGEDAGKRAKAPGAVQSFSKAFVPSHRVGWG